MFGNRLARPGEARCAIRDVAPEFAELFGQAGVADPVGNGRVLDRVPEANKPLAIRTRRDHDTTPSPNRRKGGAWRLGLIVPCRRPELPISKTLESFDGVVTGQPKELYFTGFIASFLFSAATVSVGI